MGLLDEFRAASKPARQRCSVAIALQVLTDERSEALTEAMTDPTISGTAIARVVTDWGHKLPAGSVQRHRRGVCSCGD